MITFNGHAFDTAYGNCLNCKISWREAVGTATVAGKVCTIKKSQFRAEDGI
jgi:hypothetical protein